MLLCQREQTFDLVWHHQRPRRVMHGNISSRLAELFQSCADRVLPLRPTGHNLPHFLESALLNQILKLRDAFGPRHQDDFINAAGSFEGIERVGQNRLVAEQREQLVEAHALAAPRRDDDGA
jgi:hypothetical protein